MKAIAPTTVPPLPDGANDWRRSARVGSMYHAQAYGRAVCGSHALQNRHKTETFKTIGDLQFWGVCPRCYAKALTRSPTAGK